MRIPLFRRMKRWGSIVSTVLLSSLLFAACNAPQTTLEPHGPEADLERTLFYIILAIATFIFVFVEGWLIFSIVRYRERPNMPEPRQIHGNDRIELIWTIAPSIFLFIVLFFTIYYMFGLAQPTNVTTLEVKAVGHQWWWEFDYPNQHIVTADTLEVPMGTVVQVDLVSNNVIHSFWIPALNGKTDVIPGHNNRTWFRGDQTGEYRGACAEYCGTQHAHMNFSVKVVDQNTFNTWISAQQQAVQTPTDTLAAQGAKIFAGAGGCTACHGIVGVNLNSYTDPKTLGLVGPNLTHFGSRTLIAGGVLDNNSGNLAKWLADPQSIKPGNDMFVNLTPDQINALVAYLEGLK